MVFVSDSPILFKSDNKPYWIQLRKISTNKPTNQSYWNWMSTWCFYVINHGPWNNYGMILLSLTWFETWCFLFHSSWATDEHVAHVFEIFKILVLNRPLQAVILFRVAPTLVRCINGDTHRKLLLDLNYHTVAAIHQQLNEETTYWDTV